MVEVAPQLQYRADKKDPVKLSSGVDKAVQESESRVEFLIKVCRAWSVHPAAPTGLVVAGRNRSATSGPETRHMHQVCDHMWHRRGSNTSSVRLMKRIVSNNPCSLGIKKNKCNGVERCN